MTHTHTHIHTHTYTHTCICIDVAIDYVSRRTSAPTPSVDTLVGVGVEEVYHSSTQQQPSRLRTP